MKISDRPDLALQIHEAANGLKLLYASDRSNPIICLQLYIKSGSISEDDDERGYAHLLEHLVFKCTKSFPDNDISQFASEIGAVLNAYTDFDSTCYYLTLPREKLQEGMMILAEMAFRSVFKPEDIETEKQIVLEEIYQYKAEPDADFLEYVQTNYFTDSPLKYPVLGNKQSLKNASEKSIKAFYDKHYTPHNSFIVAAGDFEESDLLASFIRQFGDWEGKAPFASEYTIGSELKWRQFSRNKKGREIISFILPELPESDPESEALHMAIRHLAIGKSSVLYKRLVEKEKLCAHVRVSSLSGNKAGTSAILFAPIKPEYKDRIITIYFEELWRVINSGVPQENLELIRNDIMHHWLYSFDGVENITTLIAIEEFNKDLSRIFNFGKLLSDIDNEAIINAVRRYWTMDRQAFFYQGSKGINQTDLDIFDSYQNKEFPKPASVPISKDHKDDLKGYLASPSLLHAFPKYHVFKLQNGMDFIYNHQPGKDICGFSLSFPLSQLNENKSGACHFATSLMLHGTNNKTYDEITRYSRERGFHIRAFHHIDSSTFRGKCHSSNLHDALALLSEIITEPRLDKKYFQILKNTAAENLRRDKDHSVTDAYIKWFKSIFGAKNNLHYYSSGNLSAISQLKLSDCEDWLESKNSGTAYSLAVVGPLEPELMLDYANKYFGTKLNYTDKREFRPVYEKRSPKLYRDYQHIDQAIIYCGGYASPASNREENTAFYVLSHLMGGDLSSRLYWTLRENNGYAYQTGFDFSSIQDLGFWNSYVLCDPDQYMDSLKALRNVFAETIAKGFEEEELKRGKTYLCALAKMDNESASFRAAAISNLLCLGYDLDYFLSREERINSIDIDILNHLAKKYLQPDNQYTYVMV
ncbi:MAG: insulinase family protein [Candidatus Cloacimonetes bacterium]|jgi:zinc protease|nr:insulinase family protein [Candidatus Cloacimonadota bacterium]